MVALGAEPSVETTAKIVSFGLKVSLGVWTFFSAVSALPSETSVIVTAGAGGIVGASATGTGVGAGAGGSFFLQPEMAIAEPNAAATRAAVNRFVMIPSLPFVRTRRSIGDLKLPARLDEVWVLDHVLVRVENLFPRVRVPVELLRDLGQAVAALDHVHAFRFCI